MPGGSLLQLDEAHSRAHTAWHLIIIGLADECQPNGSEHQSFTACGGLQLPILTTALSTSS